MDAIKLAGLQPERVFAYFEKICSMPHGSGNTKIISDYLVSLAKEQGLRYIQDELNDVIIFADGTCGYENHPAVIIQGHMDMVCEKDADCPLDMEKDGLRVTHDGTFVFAEGTTLGADDGIAVAYALALLEDRTIPHPPLEVIITVDEETGMFGAADIDLSMLKGRTLINIDSDDEGVFTVSCAGGGRASVTFPAKRRAVYGPCVRLTVDGLRGGHSGIEIHKNLANANKVMAKLLRQICDRMPICITGYSGGGKDNAITRTCQVTFVAMGTQLEQINDMIAAAQEEVRKCYDEPDAVIRGDMVDALGGNALSAQDSEKLVDLINELPNGVQTWSQDIAGLVQTSLNMGIAQLGENMEFTFAVRSSVDQEKMELLETLKSVAEKYGAEYSVCGLYPAWEYKKDSALREAAIEAFCKLYDKTPEIVAIHAGLECGLLSEKLPGLDCLSLGPNMRDIHTTRERLDIASTRRTWELLLEILKNL